MRIDNDYSIDVDGYHLPKGFYETRKSFHQSIFSTPEERMSLTGKNVVCQKHSDSRIEIVFTRSTGHEEIFIAQG